LRCRKEICCCSFVAHCSRKRHLRPCTACNPFTAADLFAVLKLVVYAVCHSDVLLTAGCVDTLELAWEASGQLVPSCRQDLRMDCLTSTAGGRWWRCPQRLMHCFCCCYPGCQNHLVSCWSRWAMAAGTCACACACACCHHTGGCPSAVLMVVPGAGGRGGGRGQVAGTAPASSVCGGPGRS
jgi:hypothetical protein